MPCKENYICTILRRWKLELEFNVDDYTRFRLSLFDLLTTIITWDHNTHFSSRLTGRNLYSDKTFLLKKYKHVNLNHEQTIF